MWIKKGNTKIKLNIKPLKVSLNISNLQTVAKAAEIARKQALENFKNSKNSVNIGAVVINGNGIICGEGKNDMRKSHPRLLSFYPFPFIHAEAAAVINSKKSVSRLNDATVVVVRVGNEGKLGNCRPCIFCQNFLFHSGVRTAVFVNEKGEFEVMSIKDQKIWIPVDHALNGMECG